MTWTMVTIVLNLSGGQPVVLPGYQYATEEACKAQLYAPVRLRPSDGGIASLEGIVSAACVPVDPSALGLPVQE